MSRLKHPRLKGARTVRLARDWLYTLGYLTETVEKTGRYVKQKDLFGLYDLIGLHSKQGVLFIQVKTNQPANLSMLKEFSKEWNISGMCMTLYDRQGWVIHWINKTGELIREDLRKKK